MPGRPRAARSVATNPLSDLSAPTSGGKGLPGIGSLCERYERARYRSGTFRTPCHPVRYALLTWGISGGGPLWTPGAKHLSA